MHFKESFKLKLCTELFVKALLVLLCEGFRFMGKEVAFLVSRFVFEQSVIHLDM